MKKNIGKCFLDFGIVLLLTISFAGITGSVADNNEEEFAIQTYSGLDSFIDNIKLTFSEGNNKVRLALEIREKEVNSAINNIQNQGEDEAVKNLERAREKLQIVQEKVSLDTSEEIKTSVDEIVNKINQEELPDEFEDYILEEEKTQLTAELTEKTFEYCKKLAEEDFDLMLKEEVCNPNTAVPGLEKELKELKNLQEELFTELMWNIRSCIDDPGTCNCEEVADINEKAKCEKMVALAVKCEYKEDETSCDELKAMGPKQGDNFAESFVPDFLMNLFREKQSMIDYDIEHSDGVPPECWNENDKPECEQYDYLKEKHGKKNNEGKDKEPTIQESIPQCFDEAGNFLEEKCGKITIVRNKEGLINYLIEKEIDDVINEFENKSAQHIININQSNEQMQVENKVWEIKEEINVIENKIVERTYATGTGPGGEGEVVIKGDKQGIITDDGGNNIVDNDVVSGGHGDDNVVNEGGSSDIGNNDVAEVDEGPGEPGIVDEN